MRLRCPSSTLGPLLARSVALCALILSARAHAAPSLVLQSDRALRFGSFVVFANGSRTVSSTGTVTDSGVFPVSGASRGPAQFTLTYDRGVPAFGPIVVSVLLNLSPPGTMSQNGLSATVANFDTDLVGIPLLTPGQSILFTMPVCTTQVCTQVFHVGGRITVTQPGTGGTITVPLSLTANLVAAL